MTQIETWVDCHLGNLVKVRYIDGNVFSADNMGNIVGVRVYNKDGSPCELQGNVTVNTIRADGNTVVFTGSKDRNSAWGVLPQSCYVVPGPLVIVIKLTYQSATITLACIAANVYESTTDSIIDPGRVIPSIAELLEKISDCEEATVAANTAAALANEKATLADQKANAANSAATAANAAAVKIDDMTVAATKLSYNVGPTVVVSEISGHKHIAFGIPVGKDFHIAKIFSSIAEMMAYSGQDLEKYDFAMIDTGSVEDPDTGKLYCYEPDKTPKWQYIGDLSGAQGIKGETGTGIDHISLNQDYTLTIYYDNNTSYTTDPIRGEIGITPDIAIGTVTTLNHDQAAYVRLASGSTPEDPVFDFGIPKGEPGSMENVYGTTIPMSTTDPTKVAIAIAAKLDKNQGAANAGKFMRIGNDGALVPDDASDKADKVQNAVAGNFAGLDLTGNLVDSGHSHNDYLETSYNTKSDMQFYPKSWTAPCWFLVGTYVWIDGENVYYSTGSYQYVLNKSTSTWLFKTWNGLTDFNGSKIWTDGENVYYSSGSKHYILNRTTSTWSVKTWNGLTDFNGSKIWTDSDNVYYSSSSDQYVLDKTTSTWSVKTWSGLTSFDANNVWTDGDNIYYNSQYVLNKSTSTWSSKTWSGGLASFNGSGIWTDGENVYYSSGPFNYVLDKATSTWSVKTWSGLTNFNVAYIWTDGENVFYNHDSDRYILNIETSTWTAKSWLITKAPISGNSIWTDGENIYYSNINTGNYILDKNTSTWSIKIWNGLTSFSGSSVWTDGENIYYSSSSDQYVLDKTTSTWSTKTWNGLTSFSGASVWIDGENIYYSSGSNHYVLDKTTSTWSTKTWNGFTNFYGSNIWTDGENIYYNYLSYHYVLDRTTSTWSVKTWNGLTSFDASGIWTDGENIYCSYSTVGNYVLDKSTSTWIPKSWNGSPNLYGASIWTDGENIYHSGDMEQYILQAEDQILFGENGRFTKMPVSEFAPKVSSAARLLMINTSISIPNAGESAVYIIPGITAYHQLVRWNFSVSAENNPPVSLEWSTGDGIFEIRNNSGTTNETIQPVFAETVGVTATQYVEETVSGGE